MKQVGLPAWLAGPVAILLAGCVGLPIPNLPPSRSTHSLDPNLIHRYTQPRRPWQAVIHTKSQQDGFAKIALHLVDPTDSAYLPIQIDWYRPDRPGRHPAILISPILAGDDLYIDEFARFFAARRLHAVIVYRKKESFTAQRPLADIEEHLRDSVIRMRETLDWLESQPEVDPHRIGAFAISMGAILTVMLAAVDPRIQACVLGLPAGHLAELLVTSQDKAIRKRRIQYLKEHRLTEEALLAQLKETLVSDPIHFASALDPQRVLCIVGLFDRVVGFSRSIDLWKAMGRPALIVLPTGHYSAALATGWLKLVTYSFLIRKLRDGE